jgi:YegS/Rv2252/BmrU family lipid kinase
MDSLDALLKQLSQLTEAHERIFVAGGDGTLHHILPAFVDRPCSLGLIPGGTGNDFAAALGIPTDVDQAIRQLLDAQPRCVDVGEADGTPFAGIAGLGIVADVLGYLERSSRRFRGRWVYPWAVIRTLMSFKPFELSVSSPDGTFEGDAMLALAANAPMFGAGMRAAPMATLTDGQLQVVILRPVNALRLLPLLSRVYRGEHLDDPSCHQFMTRQVQFKATPKLQLYADGEAMPVWSQPGTRISVRAGSLSVLA